MHVNGLNNRQQERYNRAKASQWESERSSLHQQGRALALKAESEHKTVVILVITLFAFLILASAVWIIRLAARLKLPELSAFIASCICK